jgi:hypothetical protein
MADYQSALRKPRRKSLRPGRSGNTKPRKSEALRKRWQGHEYRAKETERLRVMARDPSRRSRVGVPDGMRRAEAEKLWAEARVKATRIVDELEKAGVISFNTSAELQGSGLVDKDTALAHEAKLRAADYTEEEMAKAALKEAVVMALSPLTDAKLKAASVRIVLDWTRAKPTTKADLRLESAEAWLREVLEDHSAAKDQARS